MAITSFDDIKPTPGAAANAFEIIFEVQPYGDGTPVDGAWEVVPDITAFAPTFAPKTADTTTYAHKGSASTTKIGADWSGSLNILKIRQQDGNFQPSYLIFKNAADGIGIDNLLHVRYYDALGADEAYQGIAGISVDRQGTGNEDKGWMTVNLTGDGPFNPIPNPLAATAPVEGV